jgi:hypothetical protein
MRRTTVAERLQRAFLLALVAPAAIACGGTVTTEGSAGDGGTTQGDGAGPQDGQGNLDSDRQPDSTGQVDSSGPDSSMVPDSSYEGGCAGDAALPAATICNEYEWAPCDYDGGVLTRAECSQICPAQTDAGNSLLSCYGYAMSGEQVVSCTYCLPTGRRSEGQAEAPAVGDSPGSFFAHCAYLEAASVHAFRRLARELEAHGAPAELVARARRAADEEVSHAKTTARLSRRFGAAPRSVRAARAARLPVRDLATIARENAVEGCVRETYGVLVAMWQARTARDAGVRRALTTIARDEASHADVAAAVATWIETRLSRAERTEIGLARRRALEELRAQIAVDPSDVLVERVGMPPARDARRLLDAALREGVFPALAA